MPITTKYTMMQQVQNLLNGGDPSAAARIQPAYIMKMIEQLINKKLKADYFAVHIPSGETIPDGCMIATYEKIKVERYKGKSRAFLPAIPVSLPRGMGIYSVSPFIKSEYLAANILTATPYSSSVIKLSWTPIAHAQTYWLERADDAGFTQNVTVLYTGIDQLFSDGGLSASTTYYYRVKAVSDEYIDSDWVMAVSTTLQDVIVGKLSKPDMKVSVMSAYSLEAVWSAVANAQFYFLERSTDPYFATPTVAYYGPLTYFTDNDLLPGTTYYYRVTAIAAGYLTSDVAYASQTTKRAGIFDSTFDNSFG
jgi:hypothetical protein